MSIKKQVEAILFTTGSFMPIGDLAKHLNVTDKEIEKAISELKEDYEKKDSSLTIAPAGAAKTMFCLSSPRY